MLEPKGEPSVAERRIPRSIAACYRSGRSPYPPDGGRHSEEGRAAGEHTPHRPVDRVCCDEPDGRVALYVVHWQVLQRASLEQARNGQISLRLPRNRRHAGMGDRWTAEDIRGGKKEPEGPSARRKPKPPATVGPSGSGAPSNLSQPSWFPGRSTLSLGFGASRASPPAQLVSCPNRTSRCAQLALRLSQGSRPRFPDSAAPAARSERNVPARRRRVNPTNAQVTVHKCW